MKPQDNQGVTLSKKRYGAARLILYLQLILIIVLLFIPSLTFKTTFDPSNAYSEIRHESSNPENEITAKTSVSIFQFFIGKTESELKFSGENDTGVKFMNALSKYSTVDVIDDMLPMEELKLGMKIIIIFAGFFVPIMTQVSMKKATKIIELRSDIEAKGFFANNTYAKKVYYNLPQALEFIKNLLLSTILFTYLIIFFASIGAKMSDAGSDWTFNLWIPAIITVFLIFILNNTIIKSICSKEVDKILKYGARFDEKLSSDIAAIGYLFGGNGSVNTAKNEQSTIETLKSYKDLLDQGIITEEEFAEKKSELLGQKHE